MATLEVQDCKATLDLRDLLVHLETLEVRYVCGRKREMTVFICDVHKGLNWSAWSSGSEGTARRKSECVSSTDDSLHANACTCLGQHWTPRCKGAARPPWFTGMSVLMQGSVGDACCLVAGRLWTRWTCWTAWTGRSNCECVCMYACVRTCGHSCACMFTHMWTCMCMHVYAHVDKCVCMCTHMWTNVYACVRTCGHACVH